ncbi:Peptidase-M28 domain-containing protein [Aphelenchoides besseyi]|nr:Peptidase-M28 domain-containing protein [Aphelenchoides besseyi]
MALEDYFPDFYILAIIFCFIAGTVGSVESSEFEIAFNAYRLRQYEAAGVSYGSRSYKFSFEAVSLNQSGLRRCLVVRWKDLVNRDISESIMTSAGAILVVVPADLLPPTLRPSHGSLEEQFARFTTYQAVYFTLSTDLTEQLVDSIKSTQTSTAVEQLINVFAENAFQISSSSALPSSAIPNQQFVNIVGKLSVQERNAPSIIVVAHYDSRSIAPGLSHGYDSNGSGAMALFSLMQKLSEYYRTSDMRPKLNTIFALTALGDYNYRGSRQLAEELSERQIEGERILLVVCLESLLGGEGLNAHVSKNLQEKTAPFNFLRRMQYFMPNGKERKVITKTEIDSDQFAWEHEVYFHNRISSLTLSHFESADDVSRTALINDIDPAKEEEHLENFNWRVRAIGETLASYIFAIDMDWCTEEIRANNDCHILDNFSEMKTTSPLRQMFSTPRPAADLPQQLINDMHKITKNYCHKVEKRTYTELTMSARKKKSSLVACSRCKCYFLNRDIEKHPENCAVTDSTLYIRPNVLIQTQLSPVEKHNSYLPSDAFGWARNHTVLVNGDILDILGILPRSPCVLTCGTERFLVTLWPCAEMSLMRISAPHLLQSDRVVKLEIVHNAPKVNGLQLSPTSNIDHRLLESSHFSNYLQIYFAEAFVSPLLPLTVKYLACDLVFEMYEDETDRLKRCNLNDTSLPVYCLSDFTVSFTEGLR